LIKIDERQKKQNNFLADVKDQKEKILNELVALNQMLSKIFGLVVQPAEGKCSIVKCLNMSLEASSDIIARTIIEMIARDQLHLIDLSVENSIHKFCQKHNCWGQVK
jgi:hypothetical protein